MGDHHGGAPPTVAFDVGPLAGRATGVGAAVRALHDALTTRDDVLLRPYLLSFRARPAEGVRRLPVPAAVAHRLWRRIDRPRADRWLAPADVVHGTNYVVPPTTIPAVVSVYDCWFLRHPELAHPDVRRAGAVLLRAVRRGVVAHASSHATAERLREHCPDADVRVVHLGALPLPEPLPSSPVPELDGTPFVLAVGTLERRKNIARLVDAFGAVAADHRDVRLVLAGADGDDRTRIDASVDALPAPIRERVLLTGYVDARTRSWLVRNAQVLAYPSLDEGFGFPLLEAMSAGTPVVASTAGSIPEIAGAAAVLVDPEDVDALAHALGRTLTDSALRDALIEAGSTRVASFRWDDTAAHLVALYRSVATGERGPAPGGEPHP